MKTFIVCPKCNGDGIDRTTGHLCLKCGGIGKVDVVTSKPDKK